MPQHPSGQGTLHTPTTFHNLRQASHRSMERLVRADELVESHVTGLEARESSVTWSLPDWGGNFGLRRDQGWVHLKTITTSR